MEMNLRPATAADSEFAYQTKKAAFRTYAEMVCGWDEAEQRKIHERRFSEQDFRIVQVGGIDVGILALAREADCVKINQLFILPKYQGKGIGGHCMEELIADARRDRLPVRLKVLRVNTRAACFYRRLGFAEVGESPTHLMMERLP